MSGPPTLSEDEFLRLNRLTTSGHFVAGLAHELNNALQVVNGLVELLGEVPDLPPDVRHRIQRIGWQSDKATAAIRRVLAFTRGMPSDLGRIDLADVADHALALRQYALGRIGITVTVDRPATPCLVKGNPTQLLQVVVNLLLNAEQALIAAPERQLRVAVGREDRVVRCTVEDSGPGVDAALRDRVFEPFVTTRSSGRELGLGLTVGRAIAEAHGGSLRLAEAPRGAAFVLELPGV